MTAPAIIEYRLTEEDYLVRSYYHYLARDPSAYDRYRRARWSVFVLFFLYVLGYGTIAKWNFSDSWLLGFSAATVFFFSLAASAGPLFRRYLQREIRRQMAKGENAAYLATRWLSLTPDGILNATENCETRYAWPGIKDVVEVPGYLFLYFTAIEALIVPRRVFADEFAYEDFVKMAHSFFENAHKRER